MEFGDILKQLRKERGLSQDELAAILGVSEERAIAICHELQDAGYGNMFRVSELHD